MRPEASYDHLLDRIRQAFPGINLERAVINTDGLVNVAVINQGRVYRFARSDHAIRDLAHETRILDLVRQHVEMPVPAFEVIAPDFVTYRFIPGEPLFRNDILRQPEAVQDRLACQLADFLRALHTIPAADLTATGVNRSGGRQTAAVWLALYESVQAELFPLMYRSTRTWVDAHFAPLVRDPDWLAYEPALIHDDLAQYHILHDPADARITGVIDFGTAGLGDPARDYAMLISVYGEAVARRMAQRDARIAPLIDRARFYAGTFELQWVLGGVRSGVYDWFTAHLDRARDVLPYGQPL
jgi:aminoglycoside 2''-phosphotransferase